MNANDTMPGTPKRKLKKIEAQASALCSKALSESQAQIDICDLSKLQKLAVDGLTSGRDLVAVRKAIDEWISNRRNPVDVHDNFEDAITAVEPYQPIAEVAECWQQEILAKKARG
jgi:hypothetical protein